MYQSQAYHLGGMGCSNGVVGINMIRDLLQVDKGGQRGGKVEAARAGKI